MRKLDCLIPVIASMIALPFLVVGQQKQVSTTFYPGTQTKKVEYEYVSGKAGTVGNIKYRDDKTGLLKGVDNNKYSVSSMTPHGFWREYYQNGKLENEFNYDYGARQGAAKSFYENGSPKIVYNYNKNVIDGDFSEYYENGKVQTKCVYVNGKRTGSSTVLDPNGNPVVYLTYYEPGETGNSAGAGEKELVARALYQTKFPNGKIQEEGYLVSKYSQDRYPANYYDDFKREGIFKAYDENGTKLDEKTYKDGALGGKAMTYYSSGKVQEEMYYATNMYLGKSLTIVDGPYKAYYENGQLAKSGIKKTLVNKGTNGELEPTELTAGDWRRYSETGKMLQFMSFGRGDEVLCEMDEAAIADQSNISEQAGFSKYKSSTIDKFTKYLRFHFGDKIDNFKNLPLGKMGFSGTEIERPAMVIFNGYLNQLRSCSDGACVKEYDAKLNNVMQKVYGITDVDDKVSRLHTGMSVKDLLGI